MATVEELNAGFDAIKKDLHELVARLAPIFFRGRAIAYIDSDIGTREMLDTVQKVIDAVDAVREKNKS